MKKQLSSVLLLVTAIFLALLIGLFLGRNTCRPEVSVSIVRNAETIPTTALPASVAQTEPVFPIDINTADRYQLTLLPGIGEVLADRILAYRDAHGSFPCVEELLNVEGIGTKKLEEILDLITTGG